MKSPKSWSEHDAAELRLDMERAALHSPESRADYEKALARVLAFPRAELQLRNALGQSWYAPESWPSLDILSRPLIITEHRANYGRTTDVLIGVQGSPPRGTLWIAGVPDNFTLPPLYAVFHAPHKPPVVLKDDGWLEVLRAFLEERAIHGGGPRPAGLP